ncbi:MAG: hypothetical protein JSS91_08235 [Bacteroidetes bacterium]|nr:hypothetical protein [Bacteroidota bacterium]
MSEEEKNTENTETKETENISGENKAKKSFTGKLFSVIKYILLIFIALVIGIFIFIQTDIFSNLAKDFALKKLNESFADKQITLSAESLDGNILKGFTLNNGSIKVKSDTLLKFNSLSAKYNILKLFSKQIYVRELTFREPQINITKIRDKNDSLKWNYEYFLESETKTEDTVKSEFDWGITAENFTLENGSVRILENKNSDLPLRQIKMPQLDTFYVSKFDMSKLNINLSAKYFPDEIDANIKNFNFRTNSPFNVDNFSLHANINRKDTASKISGLNLKTDRSDILINLLSADKINPLDGFDYENLTNKEVKIDISAKPVNTDDLTFFLPELKFMDSTISFDINAEGEYGDLALKQFDVFSENSKFYFKGNVKNLQKPESLYINVKGKDIVIDPKDTRILLPGIKIPDYSDLGKISIPELSFKGEPDNFTTEFDINSGAGRTYGIADIDLRGSEIQYKGDFKTSGLNIAKIVKDKKLESSISGDFKVDARGFDYKTMSGKLDYRMIATKFYGINIAASDGRLKFNRGNVDLEIALRSNLVNTKTKGKINISNPDNLSYDLKGTASNLNLQVITKDPGMKSNLSFDFDVNGRGTSPDDIAGKFDIQLKESEFGDYLLPSTPVTADIDQKGNLRKFSIKTGFADVEADGYFNFNKLLDLVIENSKKIADNISDKFFPDSLSEITKYNTGYSVDCNNYYMNYTLNIRDLSPVYPFIGNDTILFSGELNGSLSDSCGLFTFNTAGRIDNFSYGDSVLMLKDADLNLFMRNETASTNLNKFYTDITLHSNKVITAGNKFDSVFTKINFFDNDNQVLLTANRDSTVKIYTDFSLKDSAIFRFDSLSFMFHDLNVANNSDLEIKYTKHDSVQKFDFRKFIVNSFNQRLTVNGFYSLNDSSDIKVNADNIKVLTIQQLLKPDVEIDTADVIKGNFRRTVLEYKGLSNDYQLHLETNSDVLSIGATRIGRLDAFIDYKDEELKSDIAFYNINNAGSFKLKGTVPVLNKNKAEYKDTAVYNKVRSESEINLNAKAENFQLKIFQQLLPYTKELEGILDGNIKLAGVISKPDLTGNMNLSKGAFYVTLNKMRYNFVAGISTENEKILINNSKVFVTEDPSKYISTTGFVDLTNLKMNELDLRMTGDVKAFDKDNGPTELGISGDLWVGSGSPQLKIQGNSDRIDLTGNLILVKGNVEFNPFVQEAYNIYSDDFNYGVIIDSLNYNNERVTRVLTNSTDSIFVIKGVYLNPFEKLVYREENKNVKLQPKQKSGKFYYDLLITTSENVFLKFIVNEKSQQEFFGEITTNLNLDNKENYQMSARGEVTLGNNCYYKFFRRFDATGKVNFNGPVTNPELNIDATYKGYTSVDLGGSNQQVVSDVVIDMNVSGPAANPVLAITLTKNGSTESGSNATSDAISFLLFGKFKDQLSFSESSSFGASLGASVLSNYVTSSLENIFPFLINTDLNYVDSKTGSFAENTDIRFTASVGGAIIRFGGQIFKGIANTDIIIDYPINKMLKIEGLSNDLVLRLERVYDPFTTSSDATISSGTRAGALIYYRIKF